MKNINDIIDGMPAAERAKVLARARELIAEEVALQHLRKARKLTQERMAELLGVGQDSVSRIENRSDLLLSTLRSYVEAMGGSLKLVVEFPDSVAVLSSLGEAENGKQPRPPAKKNLRKTRGRSLAHAND